jgi:hypothetical protein
MSQGNVVVAMRVRRPLGAREQDLWDSLIPEFTQEVLYPSSVRLVITDRYEELAGTYAIQSASRLNQAAIAADYRSAKPGGAMAVALTVELPDDRVAVIVNAGLTKLGREVMCRTLVHEAQHVCLIQNAVATPWTEEYQVDYLDMNHRVFDRIDAVVGEQVWNFADFATVSGIMRVDGNKKGAFTRDRQPKAAAFALRRRWRKLG